MMIVKSGIKLLYFLVLFLGLLPGVKNLGFAQSDAIETARNYLREGSYNQALPILQKVYEDAPFDKEVYSDYLDCVIHLHQYKAADSLVHYMMQIRRDDPTMLIDLGRVAQASGNKKKAKQYFDEALDNTPMNDFDLKAFADAFNNAGAPDYAIKTYLRAREQTHNPYAYATELALLYNQTGDYKGAVNAALDKAMTQIGIMDDLKDALVQTMSKDKDALKEIQKSLNQRLKQNPNNPAWQELLSWSYTQEGNYKGGLQNLIALDKTFKEDGRRLIPFANDAIKAGQFDYADQGLDYVLQQGKEKPFYRTAFGLKLFNGYQRIQEEYPPVKAEVSKLVVDFRDFFAEFPEYKNNDLWREYALVEARYNNQPDSAITLLKQVTDNSGENMNNFQGQCKLDLGDYYLLTGKVWEATLLYSQVNKAFEQDNLGETARFKNAKWAFYRGDFKLAQQQLSVLKASTSKMIANDALYLSVLITENVPKDSNLVPLKRYAAADLLLFKNQPRAADSLLDSISKAWPDGPLQDDIAMLRGKTAATEGNWERAITFYKLVLDKYGDDVLGDDAVWQLAELYRTKLKDDKNALNYYKLLIVQHPGSTYVQEARKWFQQLSGKDSSPET